jgi:hypothetical protein
LVLVGGGKNTPRTKNDVLGGRWSLVAFPELCAMVPLKKYYSGVSNSCIIPIKIASPFRHWCNWLERFVGVSVFVSIGCGFGGGYAPKSCSICIRLKFYILPFLHGLGTFW